MIDWRFLLALAALMLSSWALLIFLVLACMEAVS